MPRTVARIAVAPTVARRPSTAKIGPWSSGPSPGRGGRVARRDPARVRYRDAGLRPGPPLRPDGVCGGPSGPGPRIRVRHQHVSRARRPRASRDRDRPGLRGRRRHGLARRPRRPAGCACPRRPPRLDLHRSVCSCRRRAPRRASRDDPLAMDRRAAAPLPRSRGVAEPPVRRRRRHPDIRRRHDRDRPVPPLIRRDHGAAAANTRARALVAPPQRQGGQAQFVERLRPEASGDQLGPLRDWMLENLALPHDLDTLARRAHMSRRTLTRRFREETGVPPMAWLADARIDRARELLETTTEPVENIGRLTGLGAPASVRAAFHRHIGTSPQDYRSLFGHRTPTAARDER